MIVCRLYLNISAAIQVMPTHGISVETNSRFLPVLPCQDLKLVQNICRVPHGRVTHIHVVLFKKKFFSTKLRLFFGTL